MPTISTNLGHNAPWSSCPVFANLSLHGEYNGQSYGFQGELANAFITQHGPHEYLPEGEYVIHNDSGGPVRVRSTISPSPFIEIKAGSVGLWHVTKSNKGGFAILGENAHRVGVYLPGSVTVDDVLVHEGSWFYFNPWLLEALKPYHAVRVMNTQRINNSKSLGYSRDDPADFSHPAPLSELSEKTGKEVKCCIPHRWPESEVRSWMGSLVAEAREANARFCIEPSNEVWNSQFRQHYEVGEMWAPEMDAGKPWERAWVGYGRWCAKITQILNEVDPDKRLAFTIGSQASNSWVTGRILVAFEDAGGDFNRVRSVSIAPYYGNHAPVEGSDFATHSRRGIEAARMWILDTVQTAAERNLPVELYECGQHLVPLPDNRKAELIEWDQSTEAGEIETEYFDMLAEELPQADLCRYSLSHRPNSSGNDGTWGKNHSVFLPFDSPKALAVLDVAATFNDAPPVEPEPEPEPTDVRDLNQDGVFDIADIQQMQQVIGKVGMRYLNEPALRPEIDAIAEGGAS